ncbi:uncharacterized protein LOC110689927 isoform X1 [Chenopodium quinoa]|uniref:uncharacterized protein LOC110689927 isoform X1 n=2 Tax=Chenopodium quinoa TaxID=63459 RepID=UPI000B78F7EA|nr:uncharacterized protein LOC110689927 isoform X1 [Chenopodium quinoa]
MQLGVSKEKVMTITQVVQRYGNLSGFASAELLTIREGLLTSWDREIKFLELETVVEALGKMLNNPNSFRDHGLGNIIRDVAELLQRNWSVTVLHASRTINFVAHRLAPIGRTKVQLGERVLFHSPPAEIFDTYAAETPTIPMA